MLKRYSCFALWIAGYVLGCWIADATVRQTVWGAAGMLWGCLITNWNFGKEYDKS